MSVPMRQQAAAVRGLPLVHFTRDASGQVTEFAATGSRVRNLRFERQHF